jgi:hypothetical protein
MDNEPQKVVDEQLNLIIFRLSIGNDLSNQDGSYLLNCLSETQDEMAMREEYFSGEMTKLLAKIDVLVKAQKLHRL